jgi:hypothetical protein
MGRSDRAGAKYKWTAEPPPRVRQEIPIVRIKAGREIRCVCLSDRVEGLLVHFIGGRTRACVGSNQSCEGCIQGWNPRWKGYLAVFFPTAGKRVYLAELTPNAFESLERSAPEVRNYRGRWLSLRRDPGRANAKVFAGVLNHALFDGELPELPDVRAAIAWIMEAPDRRVPVDPLTQGTETKTEKG